MTTEYDYAGDVRLYKILFWLSAVGIIIGTISMFYFMVTSERPMLVFMTMVYFLFGTIFLLKKAESYYKKFKELKKSESFDFQ